MSESAPTRGEIELQRSEAAASIGELNAQISVARAAFERPVRTRLEPALLQVQHALLMLRAQLGDGEASALSAGVLDTAPQLIDGLTRRWTRLAGPTPPVRIPGGNAGAAALDLAAAIAERASCQVRRLDASVSARDGALVLLARLPACLSSAARVALKPDGHDEAGTGDDVEARSDALRRAMRLARSLLAARGEVTVEAERGMCAGGQALLRDTELVDRVLRETGFGCTLFEGNRRIATTATAHGSTERAIGTTTNEMVTAEVLDQGKTFHGITHTIGKDWLIRYEPLRTVAGEVVGMIATYRELDDVLR